MERGSYEGWEERGCLTMRDRIIEKTRDIIANYEGPSAQVSASAKRDIDEILQDAEQRVVRESA